VWTKETGDKGREGRGSKPSERWQAAAEASIFIFIFLACALDLAGKIHREREILQWLILELSFLTDLWNCTKISLPH
jgi:hypothetical protein